METDFFTLSESNRTRVNGFKRGEIEVRRVKEIPFPEGCECPVPGAAPCQAGPGSLSWGSGQGRTFI